MCKRHKSKQVTARLNRTHHVVRLLKADVIAARHQLFELFDRRPGNGHLDRDTGAREKTARFGDI